MMNKNLFTIVALLFVMSTNVAAYEVWIGTSCMPHNAAVQLDTWSNTAGLVTGLNINSAPIQPTEGTPSEDETPLVGSDWREVLKAYGNSAQNGMVPIPRSAVTSTTYPDKKSIPDHLQTKMTQASNSGYGIGSLMIYDNAMTVDGVRVSFSWTSDEIYAMRAWLDHNDYSDVSIMYNARNVSKAVKDKCSHPAVGDILLEAEPSLWYRNAGSRQELIKWLTTDPTTKDKRYVFQLPLSGFEDPYGDVTAFQQMRRWMQWLGTEVMDMKFMQSDQLVILPVTYNFPVFTFYPETEDDQHYANTLTGITLSLIEQEAIFSGRNGKLPTVADADSKLRTPTSSTGVERISSPKLTIYPNPTSEGSVFIQGIDELKAVKRVELFSSLGVLVLQFSAEEARGGIDISNLTNGNYFVRIMLADGVATEKLVVAL